MHLMKFIACLFVITIHAKFPGAVGDYTEGVARFAVPFFFMLSGRFLLADKGLVSAAQIRTKVKKSLLRLLKATAVVYLVYLVFSLIVHLERGVSFGEWLGIKYNLYETVLFVLFNSGRFVYDSSFVFDHMWFLFALIYVYGLIYLFAPVLRKWYKVVTVLTFAGLFFGELLQTVYPIRPFDISITTWFLLRNWLFVGLPFVLLGIIFSDYVDGKDRDQNKLFYQGLMMAALGLILTFVEIRIFGIKEVYVGSVLIILGIFFISEKIKEGGMFWWKLGRDGSAGIYYYHVLIIAIYDIAYNKDIIKYQLMWQKPFIIMAISIVLFGIIPMGFRSIRSHD
ncbi:acyltransferase family protein [Butyrivibrio proteoclasticus]|uniref:acyltransferase family protein n=1 Tax=Butyrivibrio proteoclasticus TaxID=43305 RepID=UPI0018CC4E90|nr:acyltransferase family protein [Butyrivibrio proteoclasticus]